ncbi:MAG TPA: hypothetical protein VFG30_07760 [Polyangiales bacterium]|nr:hypothetical protein [Polyangiales bacterium]
MQILDANSLSRTIDLANAAAFYGESPSKQKASQAIAFIASRFGAANAYAGTFGITPADERTRLHTFTGEALTSRASLRHIHAEEACRALILLQRVAKSRVPELDAASEKLLACFERAHNQGTPAGTYCCGPCTVALWRHMATGGLGAYAQKLDQGLRVLSTHRRADKGWRRFPFFYTLSVLAEVDLPNARKEARHHLRECERQLASIRRGTETGKRRALVLTQLLERHG